MVAIVSCDVRLRKKSNITSKDTKPKLLIRKALHRRGFRYLLHRKDLSDKPELTFSHFNAVIEINGFFWHYHSCGLF